MDSGSGSRKEEEGSGSRKEEEGGGDLGHAHEERLEVADHGAGLLAEELLEARGEVEELAEELPRREHVRRHRRHRAPLHLCPTHTHTRHQTRQHTAHGDESEGERERDLERRRRCRGRRCSSGSPAQTHTPLQHSRSQACNVSSLCCGGRKIGALTREGGQSEAGQGF
eukprot:1755343-Rhodomonas_salina.3